MCLCLCVTHDLINYTFDIYYDLINYTFDIYYDLINYTFDIYYDFINYTFDIYYCSGDRNTLLYDAEAAPTKSYCQTCPGCCSM